MDFRPLQGSALRCSIVCSVDSTEPLPEVPQSPQPEIPDKLYFRIGDVSRLAGVKAYVLRYWETEFPAIAPKKSGTGQRLYRRKDVELILEIKHLLYEKRFTIEGARKAIENRPKPVPVSKRAAPEAGIKQANLFGAPVPDLSVIRRELEDILRLLKK
jgi:DNA-binding transcriptional MerR regulator